MKKFMLGLGIFLLILVGAAASVLAWVGSEGFFRKHVLGAASDATGQPVTVETVDFSLFRRLELGGLTVGAEDEPTARISVLRIRYNLWAFLFGGRVRVEECTVRDAAVVLQTSDPKSQPGEGEPEAEGAADKGARGTRMPKLFLENVEIENLSVRVVSQADGARREVELASAFFRLPRLKSGDEFDAAFGGRLSAKEDERMLFDGSLALEARGTCPGPESTGRLEVLEAAVREDVSELLSLRLVTPVDLPATGSPKPEGTLPLAIAVNEFDVANWLALLADSGVQDASGTVNADLNVDVMLGAGRVRAEGSVRADQLALLLSDGSQLKPVSAQVKAEAESETDGTLAIRALDVRLDSADGLLVAMNGEGAIKTDPQEKSTLALTASSPVDVRRLKQVYAPAESNGDGDDKPDGDAAKQELSFPWVAITLEVPELKVAGVSAKNMRVETELRDTTATLNPSSAEVAGGSVRIEGALEAGGAVPEYRGRLALDGVAIAPLLKTMAPMLPMNLRGGIESGNVQFRGRGHETKHLLEALDIEADFELAKIEIDRMSGTVATIVNALLLSQFGIGGDKLTFADGRGDLAFRKGTVRISELLLSGAGLGLAATGTVGVLDALEPDLRLDFRLPASAGERLKARGMALKKQDDGSYLAPTLELKGAFWEKQNLARLALEYGVKTGRIDPRAGTAADALERLQNLQSTDGQPVQPQQAMEGVLKLIEGARTRDSRKDDATNADQEGEPDEKARNGRNDAAKNAIRGLLDR